MSAPNVVESSYPSTYPGAPSGANDVVQPNTQMAIPVGQPIGMLAANNAGRGILFHPALLGYRYWSRFSISHAVGTIVGALIAYFWSAWILAVEGVICLIFAAFGWNLVRLGVTPNYLIISSALLAMVQAVLAFVALDEMSAAVANNSQNEARQSVMSFIGFCACGVVTMALNIFMQTSGELARSVLSRAQQDADSGQYQPLTGNAVGDGAVGVV